MFWLKKEGFNHFSSFFLLIKNNETNFISFVKQNLIFILLFVLKIYIYRDLKFPDFSKFRDYFSLCLVWCVVVWFGGGSKAYKLIPKSIICKPLDKSSEFLRIFGFVFTLFCTQIWIRCRRVGLKLSLMCLLLCVRHQILCHQCHQY